MYTRYHTLSERMLKTTHESSTAGPAAMGLTDACWEWERGRGEGGGEAVETRRGRSISRICIIIVYRGVLTKTVKLLIICASTEFFSLFSVIRKGSHSPYMLYT